MLLHVNQSGGASKKRKRGNCGRKHDQEHSHQAEIELHAPLEGGGYVDRFHIPEGGVAQAIETVPEQRAGQCQVREDTDQTGQVRRDGAQKRDDTDEYHYRRLQRITKPLVDSPPKRLDVDRHSGLLHLSAALEAIPVSAVVSLVSTGAADLDVTLSAIVE